MCLGVGSASWSRVRDGMLASSFICLVTAAGLCQSVGEVEVNKNIAIPMRDGVRLAADLYLPKGTPVQRWPTLLCRTPYNKDGVAQEARWFAAQGYAVVVNDVRGRYASEGRWRMILDDVADGYDVCAWIVRQPWCNGKIGTFGTSYVGGTQHALALAQPPGLACMIPVDSLSNCGLAGIRHGGAFELRFMNWIFTIGAPNARAALADPALRRALVEYGKLMPQHLVHLPIRRGTTALQVVPEYESWLIEAMRHGDYDEYWKQPGYSVIDHVERYADVPVYHVTGWYDSWCRQNVLNWQYLSRRKKSPHKLIVGPWTHGGQERAWAGEIEFPEQAALQFNAWRLRWFDRWLKEVANGADQDAPVKLFVMGGGDGRRSPAGRLRHGGRWLEASDFPVPESRLERWYLHGDGLLERQPPSGDAAHSTSFLFDPANPVPTIGGNLSSTGGLLEAGGWDQRGGRSQVNVLPAPALPLSQRRDVLVFQSAPLQNDVTVVGPIMVKLYVSTSVPDTDFTAKLIDVYPPNQDYPLGFALNLTDSIVRLRYRDSEAWPAWLWPELPRYAQAFDDAEIRAYASFVRQRWQTSARTEALRHLAGKPAQPPTLGAVYTVYLHLYPTANVFQKGHRIRLDVSSSNFPRFDVNPNTGEPLQEHRRMQTAINTVYHDAQRPSCIFLPVLPAHAITP